MLHVFQEHFLNGSDQQEYLHVANVLLGRETEVVTHIFELRPFFFPLYLGLTLSVSPMFYLCAQLLCLIIAVFLLVKTVFKLCGSGLYVFIAMLFTLSSATLLMAPYQAMSESLCVLFISAFVYFYISYFTSGEKFYLLAYALFALTIAVCIKGIFLPFLCVFLIVHLVRKELFPSSKSAFIVILAFSPIIIQLGITQSILGSPTISKAGTYNFSSRYFPGIYGVAEFGQFAHYNSEEAEKARQEYPEITAQIGYLFEHPAAWATTTWSLWKHNYERGGEWLYFPDQSIQVTPKQHLFWKTSARIDTGIMWLHIIMMPLAVVIIAFKMNSLGHSPWLPMLMLLQLSIFLLSVLVYYQGDRIVLVTLPVFAVAYPFILKSLVEFLKDTARMNVRIPKSVVT